MGIRTACRTKLTRKLRKTKTASYQCSIVLINVPVAQKVIKVQHIRSHGLGLLHHVRGHGALKGRLQYPVHLSHRLREHARSEGGKH